MSGQGTGFERKELISKSKVKYKLYSPSSTGSLCSNYLDNSDFVHIGMLKPVSKRHFMPYPECQDQDSSTGSLDNDHKISSSVNSFYDSGSDQDSFSSAPAPIKVRTNFFKQRVCRSLKRKATLGERVPWTTGSVPSGPRSQERRKGLLRRIRSELHANFGLPLRGYGPRPTLSRYPGIAGITYSPEQAEQIEAQARLLADLSLARASGVTQHSQLPPAAPSINTAHSDLIVTSASPSNP